MDSVFDLFFGGRNRGPFLTSRNEGKKDLFRGPFFEGLERGPKGPLFWTPFWGVKKEVFLGPFLDPLFGGSKQEALLALCAEGPLKHPYFGGVLMAKTPLF